MKKLASFICLFALLSTVPVLGQSQQMWLNQTPVSGAPSDLNSNLLLWYKMTDGTGVTLQDSSGNSRPGSWNQAGNPYPVWSTTGGRFSGTCLLFNNVGVNESTVGSASQFAVPNPCSFSCWILASNTPMTGVQGKGFNRILETGFNGGLLLSTDNPNSTKIGGSYVASGGFSSLIATWSTNYSTNIYYNVIFTCNGKTNTLFINGVQAAQGTVGTAAGTITTSVSIGSPNVADGGGAQWSGIISDVRVWGRLITSQDIAYLQNNQ
jgi:Concanavalin A-like lectin/glucanases superfamily